MHAAEGDADTTTHAPPPHLVAQVGAWPCGPSSTSQIPRAGNRAAGGSPGSLTMAWGHGADPGVTDKDLWTGTAGEGVTDSSRWTQTHSFSLWELVGVT